MGCIDCHNVYKCHVTNMFSYCISLNSCVHLLSELSQLKECHSSVATVLPLLADSTRHKQYTQHYNYLDTVLKQVIHVLYGIHMSGTCTLYTISVHVSVIAFLLLMCQY